MGIFLYFSANLISGYTFAEHKQEGLLIITEFLLNWYFDT